MNYSITQQVARPQFAAKMNLNDFNHLLTPVEKDEIIKRAEKIGHDRNIYNLTLDGTKNDYKISTYNQVYASRTGHQNLFIGAPREYSQALHGTVFENCNKKLDLLEQQVKSLGLYI